MNTNDFKTAWSRLISAARMAGDNRDESAPFGFATRVSALAMAVSQPTFAMLCDRLYLRALGVSAVVFIACVAYNFSTPATAVEDEIVFQDPVAEMISMSY